MHAPILKENYKKCHFSFIKILYHTIFLNESYFKQTKCGYFWDVIISKMFPMTYKAASYVAIFHMPPYCMYAAHRFL